MKEESLESLLFNHPYLLDEKIAFDSGSRRQLSYPGGRIDIVFKKKDTSIFVECKRTILNENDVEQLSQYLRDMNGEMKLAGTHYLVGKAAGKLKRTFRVAPKLRIVIRTLENDIPSRLRFNSASGRYVRAADHQTEGVFVLRY